MFLFLDLTNPYSSDSFTQAFGCGFDVFFSSRPAMSLKFFSVLIIFLVFDVEVVLVLPVCFPPVCATNTITAVIIQVVCVVLLVGLLLEVLNSSLT